MRKSFLSITLSLILAFILLSSQAHVTYADDPPSESSVWWNADWMYRRRIDVMENSGYSLTNFPMQVTFQHDGKAQLDCRDIRVIADNAEVPYYVLSVNSTHVRIIFEVNVSASGTKTAYFYYGNPNASAPNYPKVPLNISEGQTGHAIIGNNVYIGWDHTSWGWSNNVEIWTDFRIDFNGNGDLTDDNDLIRDYGSRQGAIGRHRKDIEAIGLGEYQGYFQTSVYVDIIFANATLRVYRNNPWVETTNADFLFMFSPSWDYANYDSGTEQNIVDGTGWVSFIYNSSVNPGWMAFRDSASGNVFAASGINIGYYYCQDAKESSDYDRVITFDGHPDSIAPYDQPDDARIYWYADDTNGYENVERTSSMLNNPPSVVVGEAEFLTSLPHVVIDQVYVSDERADVGSVQTIGFHAKWGHNGSDVIGGTINIESITEKSKITLQKISSGLVGYWKFDEGNGTTVYDSSGNNNTGTLINGPLRVDGKYGKALSFDGIGDYVTVPDSPSLRVQSFTVKAWIYMNERPYQHNYHSAIINKLHYLGGPCKGYKLQFEHPTSTNDHLVLSLGDGTAQRFLIEYNSINDLTLNQWHHVVGTYDGTTANLYIDGKLKSSSSPATYAIIHDDTPLVIGSEYYYTGCRFNGLIDDVRIYNRALSLDLLRIVNLLPGQKVELYDSADNLKASDTLGLGENEASLKVSALTFPFSGLFKIYATDGTTLLYTTPLFEDIWGGDEYLVSGQIETEIDSQGYVINATGWVSFDDSLSSVGRKTWKVKGVNVTGITLYRQTVEDPTVVWDRVNVTLAVEDIRINVGSNAFIIYHAIYEYDGEAFSGSVTLNDTIFSQDIIGKRGYKVLGIVDDKYQLTEIVSNEVYVIFDRIKAEYTVETMSPGGVKVVVNTYFEYDDTPVVDAEVRVNDVIAENIGNGTYSTILSTWLPYLSIDIKVEKTGFTTFETDISTYLLGNIALETALAFAIVSTMAVSHMKWIHRKKLRRLEDIVVEGKRVNVKEASEVIGVNVANTRKLLSELIEKGRVQGMLIKDGKEFVIDPLLADTINKKGIIKFEEVAKEFEVTMDKVERAVRRLYDEGKIQGSFTSDGKGFITEERLKEEIRRGLE